MKEEKLASSLFLLLLMTPEWLRPLTRYHEKYTANSRTHGGRACMQIDNRRRGRALVPIRAARSSRTRAARALRSI